MSYNVLKDMDLFTKQEEEIRFKNAPLAVRMRPRNLEEFVGQEKILGEGKLLRKTIIADRIGSIILFGPPGCGKTGLAHVIAKATNSKFEKLNAVTSNVEELRKIIKVAGERLLGGVKTIVFIDEIHRFNKAQQDVLLPEIEEGVISLIGTTTLNPFFVINPAIISRSKVFELNKLAKEEIKRVILNALQDKERGLGEKNIYIEDKALDFIAEISDGDARQALNSLEIGVLTEAEDTKGEIRIDLALAKELMLKKSLKYDKDGDEHYNTISAFIKSMRGSDPDATLYWLAKMVYGGEDLRFITRRILICAAEDVGNADPYALILANAAAQAAEFVGFPEAQIILAQAAVYVACANKSNASYLGIKEALSWVKEKDTQPVPDSLKEASYKGAKELNRGQGYKYPHDFKNHYVEQDYMQEKVRFYFPADSGYEKKISERLKEWQKTVQKKI